jgi:hypothetical protein
VYGGDVAVGVRGWVDEAAGGAEEGVRLEACRGGSVRCGIGGEGGMGTHRPTQS